MYKPLVSILGDFYEIRFLFIEALYVVNLPSVGCKKKGRFSQTECYCLGAIMNYVGRILRGI